jgi:hypothetical protein
MHYNLDQEGGKVGIARKGRMDEYNAEKEREREKNRFKRVGRTLKEVKKKKTGLHEICRSEKLNNTKTDRAFFKLW